MNKKIWLSSPHMSGKELAYVKEAFELNWISPAGPHLERFEKALGNYLDVPYVASLSSGTAAIHLALIMLNIGKDDEVICSSFTFAGSCNPIAYQKATPVFVDSESQTWNMDPQALEDAIQDGIRRGKKAKAIICVHLYGMPAQIEEIMRIARRFDIPVIEDAAEGLGATFNGKTLGSFGDLGILSFNGNKIITTSGGGALVSRHEPWITKAKFLATQARDPAPHYQHSEIGYNYRLSNVSAAIGLGQMEVLDERVARRREIFNSYATALSQFSEIEFQPEAPGSFSNRWLTCVTFSNSRDRRNEKIRLALEKENIESRPLWKPMHLQPVFQQCKYFGSRVSEALFNNGLCLPSGSNMDNGDVERVIRIIEANI